MYQPGLDQGLAQIRYAEVLGAAANERADCRARAAAPKPASRRLALALAAAAPIAVLITWMLVAH
jgi:hypothetical protein